MKLIRAISGEYISRRFKSAAVFIIIISILIIGASAYLTTLSLWWLLLLIPVLLIALIGIFLLFILGIAIGILRPTLTKSQKNAVGDFVNKLERVAENLHTPPFVVLFRIMRDMLWPPKRPYLKTVIADSSSLHSDYARLEKIFGDK